MRQIASQRTQSYGFMVRLGLLKSPLQSLARPILENYGCRWNERAIKVLYEAGASPGVIGLLIAVSSKFFIATSGQGRLPYIQYGSPIHSI